MIDVDTFKIINDRYGHIYGDNVLKTISGLMEEEVEGTSGKSHHLGRWGGDEFLYILPLKNIAKSKIIANRIRKVICGCKHIDATVSIGIAQLREEDDSCSLIHIADKAMYKAKKNGGNRVETL